MSEKPSDVAIPKRAYYPSLTALRGMATLWVVVLHSSLFVGELLPGRPQQVWNFFARPGFLGVDVFFVLSGFVLSVGYSAWFEDPSARRTGTWLRFIRNRAARIFPAHLAVLVPLALAVSVVHVNLGNAGAEHRWSASGFVMSLFLVQTWFGRVDVWNAVAWSVSAEWLFYLLFPLVVRSTARTAKGLGTRSCMAIAHCAMVIVAVVETLHLRGVVSWHLPVLATAAIEFLVGALLWQSCFRFGTRPVPTSPAIHRAIWLALVLLFGSAIVASCGWPAHGGIILIPWLVSAFTADRTPRRLGAGWLRLLGEISYSLYLLHYPWQWFMRSFIPTTDFSQRHLLIRMGVLLLYLVPPFPTAVLSYHLIEKRGQRMFSART